MTTLGRTLVLVCALSAAVSAQGSDPVHLYTEAQAREGALRTELAAARTDVRQASGVRRRMRTLVGAYRDLARLFPTSGIADKALWQGAMLASDVYFTWGDAADRASAQRAFDALSTGYPASPLARQVAPQARRLSEARVTQVSLPDTAGVPAVGRPSAPVVPAADVTGPTRPVFPVAARAPRSAPARPATDAARLSAAAPLPSSLAAPLAPSEVAPTAAASSGPPVAPIAAPAPAAPSLASLEGISHETIDGAIRVTLLLDRETSFQADVLGGPPRVYVDLKNTRALERWRDAVIQIPAATAGVLERIRVGRQPGNATRVVLDLAKDTRHTTYPLYDPYRIVLDVEAPGARASRPVPPAPAGSTAEQPAVEPPLAPATVAPLAAAARTPASLRPPASAPRASTTPAPTPAHVEPGGRREIVSIRPATPARLAAMVAGRAPGLSAEATSADLDRAEEVDGPAPVAVFTGPPEPSASTAATTAAPSTAARTARGDYSLSRQLGLGVAKIVIDAGHGGHDPGAKVKGLTEAGLVLDIALRLEALLRKQPGVDVVLTRRTDSFVSLEERTETANRAGADLFISIHANASANPKARGIETYVLNFASTPEAEAIAARENSGSSKTMRHLPDIVKAIALNNKVDESRELARFVQGALTRKGDTSLRNLGVKQAPFMVLVGATMPAILTEIAFVTNRDDASLLRTDKFRQDTAEALLAGITRYQQSLKKAPAIAAQ